MAAAMPAWQLFLMRRQGAADRVVADRRAGPTCNRATLKTNGAEDGADRAGL
jgi:hypothetical protein